MTPKLRRWEPKEKSPLPAPSDEFIENEAAISWGGYTKATWETEHWVNKAKVIAHHLVKATRESYAHEVAMEKAKKESKKDGKGGGDGLVPLDQALKGLEKLSLAQKVAEAQRRTARKKAQGNK